MTKARHSNKARRTAMPIIALLFAFLFVCLFAQGALAGGADRITISQIQQNGQDVSIHLSAYDADGAAASEELAPENVTITINAEDDVHPSAVSRFSSTGEGVAYVVCVDVSKSITKADMDKLKTALSGFVGRLGQKDFVKIMSIGESVRVACDYTDSRPTAYQAIDQLSRNDNKTQLLQGLSDAMNAIRSKPTGCPSRDAIIVFTDGGDDSDQSYTEAFVLEQIDQTKAPLFFIGLPSTVKNVNYNSMGVFAERSSGRLYGTSAGLEAQSALNRIASVLSDGYVLALRPRYEQFGQPQVNWRVTVSGSRNLTSNAFSYPLTLKGVPTPTAAPTAMPTPAPTLEATAEPPLEPTPAPLSLFQRIGPIWWAAIGAVLLLCIALAVILARRGAKKDTSDLERIQVHVESDNPYEHEIGGLYEDERTIGMFDDEATIALDTGADRRVTIIVQYAGNKKERTFMAGAPITIGQQAGNTLVLEDRRVSRKHTTLFLSPDGQMRIKDNDSRNGTFINGKRILEETPIRSGTELTVGETKLFIKY